MHFHEEWRRVERSVGPAEQSSGKGDHARRMAAHPEEGLLRCKGSAGVGQVTIEVNAKRYAVNGTAKNDRNNADIQPIWANDTTPGLKKNISPLIQEGLRLCK
jgi:hypothetical protein